jgi:hypothetical protein
MTTRKPKPAFSPVIECPAEQLQWVPVTVEHKPAVPAGKTQWPEAAAIGEAEPLQELLADPAGAGRRGSH